MLLVHYFNSLSDQAIEVWNLFGARDKVSYISVHSAVQNLDKLASSWYNFKLASSSYFIRMWYYQ